MARKRADQLKVGQAVIYDGEKHIITHKTLDGDIHVIELDHVISIRRPAGAKLELA